uniref:DEPDC5_CTD domain-containing protein n=1 Tax=Rhabditophanes sp. KR3021 TaxID=114890 RepID=A0AC35TTS8_9BILA
MNGKNAYSVPSSDMETPEKKNIDDDNNAYVKKVYNYLFQVPDMTSYYPSCTTFKHHRLDIINWELLDKHLETRFDDEMYIDGEVCDMKCWSTRFVLLPASDLYAKKFNELKRGDVFEPMMLIDTNLDEYIMNFCKFMVGLNAFARGGFDLMKFDKHLLPKDQLDEIIKRWKKNVKPLRYKEKSLCDIFVLLEFMVYLKLNVENMDVDKNAINFIKELEAANKIQRLKTNDIDLSSCFGFIFYVFVDELNGIEELKKIRAIVDNDSLVECEVVMNVPQFSTRCNQDRFRRRANMEIVSGDTFKISQNMANYNECAKFIFDRTFTPGKGYEIQLKWIIATGSKIVANVEKWCRKADLLKFHVVPIPEDLFALATNAASSPLRIPIPIELRCEDIEIEYLPQMIFKMIELYGFLPYKFSKSNKKVQYVHITGGMFLMFQDEKNTFQWSWNHMFSDHSTIFKSSCSEEFHDNMLADFRAFCLNKDGRLSNLYKSIRNN